MDSVKDRDRRAILRKITTLFGTSVPPALPNDHQNTSKASRAFALRPHLSNAPWSRRTVSLRSRRKRERPKATGDSEGNRHFIWHLGPSCVAKRSPEHFKSKQGVCVTLTLERNAPWSRFTVDLRSRRGTKDRNRRAIPRKITTLLGTSSLMRCQTITRTL